MKRMDVAHWLLPSLLLTALILSTPSRAQRPPLCRVGLIVDCVPNHEDIVWARGSDGNCLVYANRCVFNNNNCHRYLQGHELFEEIPKQECQRLCRTDCPAPEEAGRVCGQRGERLCYFGNECLQEKHVCTTGEIWRWRLNRFCDGSDNKGICPELEQ